MWTQNWDQHLPGLRGMHSNQPVCVRSDENVSGKFLVVRHFCSVLFYASGFWTNLDFFTLSRLVTIVPCVTNDDSHASQCHEGNSALEWRLERNLDSDLIHNLTVEMSWDLRWWLGGVILSAVTPAWSRHTVSVSACVDIGIMWSLRSNKLDLLKYSKSALQGKSGLMLYY